MQTRPDQPALLDAVAQFLLEAVAPTLEADKALQFRVLIAANLSSVVADELRTHDARFAAEAQRLAALLPDAAKGVRLDSPDGVERATGLEALSRELAARLRAGTLSAAQRAAALEHVWLTARQTLEVTNPRFDLAEDL